MGSYNSIMMCQYWHKHLIYWVVYWQFYWHVPIVTHWCVIVTIHFYVLAFLSVSVILYLHWQCTGCQNSMSSQVQKGRNGARQIYCLFQLQFEQRSVTIKKMPVKVKQWSVYCYYSNLQFPFFPFQPGTYFCFFLWGWSGKFNNITRKTAQVSELVLFLYFCQQHGMSLCMVTI